MSVGIFNGLQYFLVQKLEGKKIKIRFRLFNNNKKKLMAIKPEGGGQGLNGPAIKKGTFFCSFPYNIVILPEPTISDDLNTIS